MDWGHGALSALAVVLAVVAVRRVRRHRDVHIRIDWEDRHDRDR